MGHPTDQRIPKQLVTQWKAQRASLRSKNKTKQNTTQKNARIVAEFSWKKIQFTCLVQNLCKEIR